MKPNSGFIAFTSLLVVSAVALAIAVSISLIGVSSAKSSLDFKKGQESLKIAEGCAEEALFRLRDNAGFSSSTLNVGKGSCTINVTGAGVSKTIDVTATISNPPDYIKKLQIGITRSGTSINITGWAETQ